MLLEAGWQLCCNGVCSMWHKLKVHLDGAKRRKFEWLARPRIAHATNQQFNSFDNMLTCRTLTPAHNHACHIKDALDESMQHSHKQHCIIRKHEPGFRHACCCCTRLQMHCRCRPGPCSGTHSMQSGKLQTVSRERTVGVVRAMHRQNGSPGKGQELHEGRGRRGDGFELPCQLVVVCKGACSESTTNGAL